MRQIRKIQQHVVEINHFMILIQCIAMLYRDIAKKNLQKRFCQFSALCVIVLVFFYYTILSYTTMVKGCVLCLVRSAAQLRLAASGVWLQ